MPVVDRREFGGRFGVKENSQRLANYRYLEIQLMEMIGGWSHTTPQLALKATFGYHVYDHAQAANAMHTQTIMAMARTWPCITIITDVDVRPPCRVPKGGHRPVGWCTRAGCP